MFIRIIKKKVRTTAEKVRTVIQYIFVDRAGFKERGRVKVGMPFTRLRTTHRCALMDKIGNVYKLN